MITTKQRKFFFWTLLKIQNCLPTVIAHWWIMYNYRIIAQVIFFFIIECLHWQFYYIALGNQFSTRKFWIHSMNSNHEKIILHHGENATKTSCNINNNNNNNIQMDNSLNRVCIYSYGKIAFVVFFHFVD